MGPRSQYLLVGIEGGVVKACRGSRLGRVEEDKRERERERELNFTRIV